MKNIVWLVSYPKSGNTWVRMFLANYLKNELAPVSLEEIKSAPIAGNALDFEELVGLNPFELTADEVDLYRPDLYRLLSEGLEKTDEILYKKTHDAYTSNATSEPLFPEEISRGAIYFIRNPLDICVSYANHNAEKLHKTVDFLLNEKSYIAGKRNGQLRQKLLSWKCHVQSWMGQSLIPVHAVRYEDMQQKPTETFGSIIKFLNLEYSEERLVKAIVFSDFKLLQQMEQKKGFRERLQYCEQFFWKGKIGNFRDYLSEEQIHRIVEYNYDTMKEFGYIDERGKLAV
jgi:aryl sulfotransferase